MTLKDLTAKIENLFSIGELRDLCFHLDIDYDNLPGETKKEKTRELVLYCNRHDQMGNLLDHCQQLRPSENWVLENQNESSPLKESGLQSGSLEPQNFIISNLKKQPSIVYGLAIGIIVLISVFFINNGNPFGSSDIQLAVRVTDSQNQPVSGAEILLFYEGGPFNQFSDNNGVGFFLADSSRANVQLITQANGFKVEEQTIRLNRDQNVTVRLNEYDENDRRIIVRVLDSSTNNPVDSAEVRIIINGNTYTDSTDSNGLAYFTLEFLSQTIEVDLSVESASHQIENQTVTIRPEQIQDVRINPNAIVSVNSIVSTSKSDLTGISSASANQTQYNVNLVQNPSNEEPVNNGRINSWDTVAGPNWGQGAEVPVHDGIAYFDAGEAGIVAELKQDIDLSAFASEIDQGNQVFEFSAFVSSFPPQLLVPADSSKIIVEFYDDSFSNLLDSLATEEIIVYGEWFEIKDTIIAPENTKWVRIRLISTKYGGFDSDGYFDSVSLIALESN